MNSKSFLLFLIFCVLSVIISVSCFNIESSGLVQINVYSYLTTCQASSSTNEYETSCIVLNQCQGVYIPTQSNYAGGSWYFYTISANDTAQMITYTYYSDPDCITPVTDNTRQTYSYNGVCMPAYSDHSTFALTFGGM